MNYLASLILVLLSGCSSQLIAQAQHETCYLFIATYTDSKPDKGIYVYRFDESCGKLTKVSNTENVTNPSFVTLSPNGQYLYACTETQMPGAGSVSAFLFDSVTGSLAFMNKQASGGENPVYVTVNSSGKWLVNANYTEGSVAVHPIDGDGRLLPADTVIAYSEGSANPVRQTRAHVHCAVFSPQQDYVFLPDLGADKIRAYLFDTMKKQPLQPAERPYTQALPGSGPRHLVFHPDGRYAYCVEELSGTISAYKYHEGQLERIQRIASYNQYQDRYMSADIHLSPDGLFLYSSNREDEHSISIFAVDTATGQLTKMGSKGTGGKHPRMFTIDPSGNFLLVANMLSNKVTVFKRNTKTGKLTKTKNKIKVPSPSCLQMRKYRL